VLVLGDSGILNILNSSVPRSLTLRLNDVLLQKGKNSRVFLFIVYQSFMNEKQTGNYAVHKTKKCSLNAVYHPAKNGKPENNGPEPVSFHDTDSELVVKE
jgi:hypothetical protein